MTSSAYSPLTAANDGRRRLSSHNSATSSFLHEVDSVAGNAEHVVDKVMCRVVGSIRGSGLGDSHQMETNRGICSQAAFVVFLFCSAWMGSQFVFVCKGSNGIQACSHVANALGCNGWYSRSDQPCRNACGFVVTLNGSDDKRISKTAIAYANSSAIVAQRLSECWSIYANDTCSPESAERCLEWCYAELGNSFMAPSCMDRYVLSKVCFKAFSSYEARALPRWVDWLVSFLYVMLSLTTGWMATLPEEPPPEWVWAETARCIVPICCCDGDEQKVAMFDMRKQFVELVTDRFLDIKCIFVYIRLGQPFYAIVNGFVLCIKGDFFQRHAIVEWRMSRKRGHVMTRAFIENKAKEALLEGPVGVLVPVMVFITSEVSLIDVPCLVQICLALVMSFLQVINVVGGFGNLAGEMYGRELMPYSIQRKMIKEPITKLIRAAEICCYIPCVLCVHMWSTSLVYVMACGVFGVTSVAFWVAQSWRLGAPYVVVPPVVMVHGGPLMNARLYLLEEAWFQRFPFQVLNPRAAGLLSVLIGTSLWFVPPMWSGNFGDCAASTAKRPWIHQLIRPIQPPLPHYIGLLLLAILSWGVAVLPCYGVRQIPFTDWRSERYDLYFNWDALAFWENLILAFGLIGPVVLFVVLLIMPERMEIRDTDAARHLRSGHTYNFMISWIGQQLLKRFSVEPVVATAEVLAIRGWYQFILCSRQLDGQSPQNVALTDLQKAINDIEIASERGSEVLILIRARLSLCKSLQNDRVEAKAIIEAVRSEVDAFDVDGEVSDLVKSISLLVVDYQASRQDIINLGEDALAGFRRKYGAEDKMLACHLARYGAALQFAGQAGEAAEVLERALHCMQSAYKSPHGACGKYGLNMHMSRVLRTFGLVHNQLGQHEQALEKFRASYQIAEAAFGPQSLEVADVLLPLAQAHIASGEAEEAARCLQLACVINVAHRRTTLHPSLAGIYKELGRCLKTLGKPKEAEDYLKRALDINMVQFPENHKYVLDTRRDLEEARLGVILEDLGLRVEDDSSLGSSTFLSI